MTSLKNSERSVIVEFQELCPICGSRGSIYLRSCRDYICGLVGNWAYQKCHQCKSLWLTPPPSPEMIGDLYPPQYYTHGAASERLQEPQQFLAKVRYSAKLENLQTNYGYSGLTQPIPFSVLRILSTLASRLPGATKKAGYTVRFQPYRHNGRLLEVGPGNGNYMHLMKRLGWQVEGIEPDPYAAQIAIASGLNVKLSTAEDAIIEPNSYDAIVLHHVTEHLLDPKIVLQKLACALKSGGMLVSISPNPSGIIANLFGNKWYELDPPRHLVLPSPDGYKRMLSNSSVKTEVRTSMQIAFWILRESISIKQTGTIGQSKYEIIPKAMSLFGTLLSQIFPTAGEEVICIAHKQ